MSASAFVGNPMAGGKREPITQATVQKMLDENTQLIQAIMEYQNQGKMRECSQYQQILHRNLIFLATLADSTLNQQLPQSQQQSQPNNQSQTHNTQQQMQQHQQHNLNQQQTLGQQPLQQQQQIHAQQQHAQQQIQLQHQQQQQKQQQQQQQQQNIPISQNSAQQQVPSAQNIPQQPPQQNHQQPQQQLQQPQQQLQQQQLQQGQMTANTAVTSVNPTQQNAILPNMNNTTSTINSTSQAAALSSTLSNMPNMINNTNIGSNPSVTNTGLSTAAGAINSTDSNTVTGNPSMPTNLATANVRPTSASAVAPSMNHNPAMMGNFGQPPGMGSNIPGHAMGNMPIRGGMVPSSMLSMMPGMPPGGPTPEMIQNILIQQQMARNMSTAGADSNAYSGNMMMPSNNQPPSSGY